MDGPAVKQSPRKFLKGIEPDGKGGIIINDLSYRTEDEKAAIRLLWDAFPDLRKKLDIWVLDGLVYRETCDSAACGWTTPWTMFDSRLRVLSPDYASRWLNLKLTSAKTIKQYVELAEGIQYQYRMSRTLFRKTPVLTEKGGTHRPQVGTASRAPDGAGPGNICRTIGILVDQLEVRARGARTLGVQIRTEARGLRPNTTAPTGRQHHGVLIRRAGSAGV